MKHWRNLNLRQKERLIADSLCIFFDVTMVIFVFTYIYTRQTAYFVFMTYSGIMLLDVRLKEIVKRGRENEQ